MQDIHVKEQTKTYPGSTDFSLRKRISRKAKAVMIPLITLALFSCEKESPQEFLHKKVSEKVSIIFNPDLGNQVVIQSDQGLVVFDSFWSDTTAQKFKKEINKNVRRDDFAYVINMVDRIDMIGGNASYPGARIIGHANISAKYGDAAVVEAERRDLIEMWRHKADLAKNRLEKMDRESDEALNEKKMDQQMPSQGR